MPRGSSTGLGASAVEIRRTTIEQYRNDTTSLWDQLKSLFRYTVAGWMDFEFDVHPLPSHLKVYDTEAQTQAVYSIHFRPTIRRMTQRHKHSLFLKPLPSHLKVYDTEAQTQAVSSIHFRPTLSPMSGKRNRSLLTAERKA
uniref:Uncharacterized protein n=1 Tax=Timema tahoe TaxID=61484 RepID=A0A7R9FLE4_9NEOP|nr:unnamed protein product [Timema tahoe]